MKNYLDITVCISPGVDGDYAVRVSSESGQGNSTLKLPFSLRELSGAVFGVAETARDVSSDALGDTGRAATDPRSAAEFGVKLFEALFQGEARDILAAAESKVQSSVDTGVRIRLSMDLQAEGMAEVASLPWELMCRRGQRALAVSTQTPLVRSLDSPRPTEPRPFVAPLRILALMSNPSGTGKLNLDAERAAIERSWARLPGVHVDFVRPVQAEILDKLAGGDYHVIHYMGHGDFEADGGGMLLLEHEDGSPDRVSGDVFAAWLADEPLRLVFLNACKTGTTGTRKSAHPFAGIATALIRERVPAVVAMQFPISDQAAIAFAQTFYQRISQGFPVDAAVAEGRKVLYSSKQAEWATPVLYLRSRDGMLFVSEGQAAPAANAAPVSPGPATTAAATSVASGADDPWGSDAGDALRVFLTTPDQNLVKRHGQLAQALKGLTDVRVVDSVPTDEIEKHAAAAENLARRADLCVHMLGANPGMRLDDDDEQPLRTFPLVELDIGRRVARSQLVVITSEDKESIGIKSYAAMVDELAKLPRDKARFELVVTDKNRIAEAVKAKLEELRRARQASVAPGAAEGKARSAFVDAHLTDQERAFELRSYLKKRNVRTEIRGSSSATFAQLDDAVKKSSLYVIVAGAVDKDWVSNRSEAVMKSALKSRSPLLVAEYSAPPTDGAEQGEVSKSQFEISALNDGDTAWVDALFAPATGDRS